MGHLAADVTLAANHVRFRQCFIRITELMVVLLFDVMGFVIVNPVRLRLHRFQRIEVGRQQLVVNFNQLQRLPGHLFTDRRHPGYVVADVAHLVDNEDGLIVPDGQYAIPAGVVRSGNHGFDPG